jgi:5-methylcytosine-specific restriction endonuclease McrA
MLRKTKDITLGWLQSVPRGQRMSVLHRYITNGRSFLGRDKLEARRKEFDEVKEFLLPRIESRECYVCSRGAKHRHHVVPLFRAGGNKKDNLVALCGACHTRLHSAQYTEAFIEFYKVPPDRLYKQALSREDKEFLAATRKGSLSAVGGISFIGAAA